MTLSWKKQITDSGHWSIYAAVALLDRVLGSDVSGRSCRDMPESLVASGAAGFEVSFPASFDYYLTTVLKKQITASVRWSIYAAVAQLDRVPDSDVSGRSCRDMPESLDAASLAGFPVSFPASFDYYLTTIFEKADYRLRALIDIRGRSSAG